MKKVLLMLACCGLLAAPAFAQESPNADDLKSKTRDELLEDLHKLMKEASKEMDGLERDLARTSLGPARADIIAERIKRLKEAMSKGELSELPEGLRVITRLVLDPDLTPTVGQPMRAVLDTVGTDPESGHDLVSWAFSPLDASVGL